MKSASHFEFLIIFQFCLKIFLSFPRCFTFSTQNFTKIGSLLSEIWRCDYFKSRPASWFLKSIYHHSGAEFAFSDQISRKSNNPSTFDSTIWIFVKICHHSYNMIQRAKFHRNQIIFHRDMSILRFLCRRASAIFDLRWRHGTSSGNRL